MNGGPFLRCSLKCTFWKKPLKQSLKQRKIWAKMGKKSGTCKKATRLCKKTHRKVPFWVGLFRQVPLFCNKDCDVAVVAIFLAHCSRRKDSEATPLNNCCGCRGWYDVLTRSGQCHFRIHLQTPPKMNRQAAEQGFVESSRFNDPT